MSAWLEDWGVNPPEILKFEDADTMHYTLLLAHYAGAPIILCRETFILPRVFMYGASPGYLNPYNLPPPLTYTVPPATFQFRNLQPKTNW